MKRHDDKSSLGWRRSHSEGLQRVAELQMSVVLDRWTYPAWMGDFVLESKPKECVV